MVKNSHYDERLYAILRFIFEIGILFYKPSIERRVLSMCLVLVRDKFYLLQNNCIIHEILALWELLKMIYIGG